MCRSLNSRHGLCVALRDCTKGYRPPVRACRHLRGHGRPIDKEVSARARLQRRDIDDLLPGVRGEGAQDGQLRADGLARPRRRTQKDVLVRVVQRVQDLRIAQATLSHVAKPI